MIPRASSRARLACIAAMALAGCGAEAPPEATIEPLTTVDPRPGIYAEFTLTADLSAYTENQREMIVKVVHPEWGEIKALGCPVKFSDQHLRIKSSPGLGEHNEEIFSHQLGLSRDEMKLLKDRGIIL